MVTHSLDLVVSLPCPGKERNYFGLRSRALSDMALGEFYRKFCATFPEPSQSTRVIVVVLETEEFFKDFISLPEYRYDI